MNLLRDDTRLAEKLFSFFFNIPPYELEIISIAFLRTLTCIVTSFFFALRILLPFFERTMISAHSVTLYFHWFARISSDVKGVSAGLYCNFKQ